MHLRCVCVCVCGRRKCTVATITYILIFSTLYVKTKKQRGFFCPSSVIVCVGGAMRTPAKLATARGGTPQHTSRRGTFRAFSTPHFAKHIKKKKETIVLPTLSCCQHHHHHHQPEGERALFTTITTHPWHTFGAASLPKIIGAHNKERKLSIYIISTTQKKKLIFTEKYGNE